MDENTYDCDFCDTEIELESFPYNDGFDCPNCKARYETDWEESNDSMFWWVTSKKQNSEESTEA